MRVFCVHDVHVPFDSEEILSSAKQKAIVSKSIQNHQDLQKKVLLMIVLCPICQHLSVLRECDLIVLGVPVWCRKEKKATLENMFL